jgi:hypothetical protein
MKIRRKGRRVVLAAELVESGLLPFVSVVTLTTSGGTRGSADVRGSGAAAQLQLHLISSIEDFGLSQPLSRGRQHRFNFRRDFFRGMSQN